MSRLEPKNRMEAYAHQLSDDVQMLFKCALIDNENGYDKCIDKMQGIIKAYYSPVLRKQVEKTKKENQEREAYMKKNYPEISKL